MKHRYGFVAVLAAISVVALRAPVSAHIDPDPKEAQAGAATTVGFTVEHGCAGSPTIALDMRLPDGVGAPTPVPPDGWEGTVEGRVVSFVGGPLPDDQQLTFRVDMTLPATPDTTIYFPFVQRCEDGEIRWIDLPADDSTDELDEPAPAMLLVGPVAQPDTTAVPDTTIAPDTTAVATTVPSDTTNPPTTTTPPTTAAPDTTAATDTPASSTTEESSDVTTAASTPPDPDTETDTDTEAIEDAAGDDGADGSSWSLIALGVAAVAAIAAGVVAYRRRP